MSGFSWNVLYVILHCFCLLRFYEINSAKIVKYHHQKRYTENEICSETNKTRGEVSRCPNSIQSFNDSTKKKNCENLPRCTGQQLVYHCIVFKERFVEVCAPRVLIIGHCCPIYDEGIGRVVEDYSRPCPDCSFQYYSDEIVQSCVKTKNQTLSEKIFPVTEESFERKPMNDCSIMKGRSKRNIRCKSRKNLTTTDVNLRNTTLSVITTPQYISGILDQDSKKTNDAFFYVFLCITTIVLAATIFVLLAGHAFKKCNYLKCGNKDMDQYRYQVTVPLHATDQ